MGVINSLINFTLSLLPDGPLWRDTAGQRLGTAIARAFEPVAEFVAGLRDAIFPGTAGREVLLQWWEWLRGSDDCIATPADTEELRASVQALLRARKVDTIAGFRSAVRAFLPNVDIEDLLVVSTLPLDVPFSVEPTGRVVRIWYPEFIVPLDVVECVVKRFQPAGDRINYVTPSAVFQSVGFTADENALLWARGDSCRLVITRSLLPGLDPVETVYVLLTERDGSILLTDAFSVIGSTLYIGNEFQWWFERDFQDGLGFVQVSNAGTFWLATDEAEAFTVVTGLVADLLLPGTRFDVSGGGADFVARGAAVDGETAWGIKPNPITSKAMVLTYNVAMAWDAPVLGIGDFYTGTPMVWFWVWRSANPVNSLTAILGDRDNGSPNLGWEVTYPSVANTSLIARLDDGPNMFTSTVTGNHNNGQWHVGSLWFASGQFQLITDVAVGTTALLPGVNVSSPDLFAIGARRLVSAGMEVALVAKAGGAQVASVPNRAAVVAALKSFLVQGTLLIDSNFNIVFTLGGEPIYV